MKRRSLAVVLVVVALLAGLSTACDWSKRTVVDMGLIDSPAPAPLVDDVACDGSRGSTCSAATLALTLRPALSAAASRPGKHHPSLDAGIYRRESADRVDGDEREAAAIRTPRRAG